jgi:hypothetical protein
MVTARDPVPTAMPLEDQARALLRSHPGDGLEAWLADQRLRAAQDGSWVVETPDRDGWTCRVEGVPGEAVRVVAPAAGAVSLRHRRPIRSAG